MIEAMAKKTGQPAFLDSPGHGKADGLRFREGLASILGRDKALQERATTYPRGLSEIGAIANNPECLQDNPCAGSGDSVPYLKTEIIKLRNSLEESKTQL